jgi:hypothetical protein
VLEALEALSCFDAWSWINTFWNLSQQNKYAMEAKDSLVEMLTMVCDQPSTTSKRKWMETANIPQHYAYCE